MITESFAKSKVGFERWAAITRLHDGKGRAILNRALFYHAENGDIYTVPRDFKTDLASTPRLVWFIFPPWDNYASAAILHDWLYTIRRIERAAADALFLEAMSHSNVPKWKRRLIYYAVRLCGGSHWVKGEN